MAIILILIIAALLLLAVPAFASTGDTVDNAQVQRIAKAISIAEGFGVDNAIPTMAHNPGDLVLGDVGYGTLGAQQITIFADDAAGWQALYNEITKILGNTSSVYNSSMTIAEVAAKWAGYSGANDWASNVADALGVTTDTPIGEA